ncbi:copper tolerance protein [Methylopila jiangsuensis]|uniref:Copper tolerance protein n=1 Tax=Methylopila jiangsuensis TaxID=586230 RepID=A0A9W6JL06_9HYPH|nr:TolC family protein [Methylopila jiangsuensis]MDR6284968.1 outer membrane protein TolC [Methylopila jiangsuensis]GLK77644.1 copper tolerance protein [Methylopila jiangsuensis]
MRSVRSRLARASAVAALSATLGACASISADRGMTPVVSRVSLDLGKDTAKIVTPADAAAVRSRVARLLGAPLTADAAVQIALLNNRGLQAEYNALGVSEAEYVEASLPPSPTVSIERVTYRGELDVERRLVADLLSLLTLPRRAKIAETEFRAAQYKTIQATFRTAANARRAYYRAVAARETAAFLETARASAAASAELTKKLGETGATTKLNQARSGALYAEVATELAEARLEASKEREALTRELGLWGRDLDYRLPSRLPGFPRLKAQSDVEATALRRRVDLIGDRLELDALAQSYGLTEQTRAISMLEVTGIANHSKSAEGDKANPKGFEVAVQIPIFDFGKARSVKAQEAYMGAVNRLLEKAVNVRSEAREAYATYRGRYDIARAFQTRVLPLRKIITDESQLQYNGMLVDAFELLTNARENVASNVAAIRAKRDFFIADVDFQAALIGGGGAEEASPEPKLASAASASSASPQ